MGRQAVTIRDVAREANVSVATVSRALNGHSNVAEPVRRQVLVAPPVLFLDFAPVAAPLAELAVIVGDRDTMAPLATLRALLPHWHPTARLCIVAGADHFFGAALDRLTAQIEAVLAEPS